MSTADLQKHRDNFWPALIAVIFGAFMAILSNTLINVAIPSLMSNFNTSLDTVEWVLTGFMLAGGTIIPITGFLGDRFSYKRVYLVSILGFSVFSFLCSISWSISTLIVFRVLQGVFGGMVMPVSMAMVYQIVPVQKRGVALGVWGIAAMAGPAIGPTLSGWIIQNADWRWLFIINVPVGLLAFFVGLRLLPYYKLTSPKKLDVVGLVAVVVSSVSYLLAFSEGNSWGWTSFQTVALLFLATVCIIFFIGWELTVSEPLLDLRVFKKFRFTISVIVGVLITVGLFSGTYLTPVYLQNIQGTSPIETGLVLLPAAIAMAIFMPISGRLFDKIGGRFLVPVGVAVLVFGTLHVAHLTPSTPHSYVTFWMCIRNIGIGIAMMPATTSGMNTIPVELSGRAASLNNWIRQVMASFSISLFTSMMTTRGALHAAALGEKVNMFSSTATNWISGLNQLIPVQADQNVLPIVALYGEIQKMAFSMSVNDVYFVAAMIMAVAIPLGFLLGGAHKHTIQPTVPAKPPAPTHNDEPQIEVHASEGSGSFSTGKTNTPVFPRLQNPKPELS